MMAAGPPRKILVMGLPGAGKTTLTRELAPLLDAVVFNADEVRATISRELSFSHDDRIQHARRMGLLCDEVVRTGRVAIADFVCPTPQTRAAFGPAFLIWVDRITEGRYPDTNRLFVPPAEDKVDVRVTAEETAKNWALSIAATLRIPSSSLQSED